MRSPRNRRRLRHVLCASNLLGREASLEPLGQVLEFDDARFAASERLVENTLELTQVPRPGVLGKELKLVSDNGCQPTSTRFMKSCNTLGIKQIFTSYNNPKGNAETERSIRTLKEELFWIKEWQGLKQVEDALDKWVDNYNKTYLHSALGYRSPEWVEENFSKEEVA